MVVNKKSKIVLPSTRTGTIYIQSTKNNTILTLVDADGRVKAWSSGGTVGLKNSRKATAHAAELAAQQIATKAQSQTGNRNDPLNNGLVPNSSTATKTGPWAPIDLSSHDTQTFPAMARR